MTTKKNTAKRTNRPKSERAVDLILSMPMGELIAMIDGIAKRDHVTAQFMRDRLSDAVIEQRADDQD